MKSLKCPNCGSLDLHPTGEPGQYRCENCGGLSFLDNRVHVLVSLPSLRCPKCGAYNPLSADFCTECGAPLTQVCPFCESSVRLDKKYCPYCGNLIRGLPESTPRDVQDFLSKSLVCLGNKTCWFYKRIPSSFKGIERVLAQKHIKAENVLWGITPPSSEFERRLIDGNLMFVFSGETWLVRGILLATDTHFVYYRPGKPAQKKLFRTIPAVPTLFRLFPYSQVVDMRYGYWDVPQKAFKRLLSSYPLDYYPAPDWVARGTQGFGMKIQFSKGVDLRFQVLPNVPVSMEDVRFWEELLRLTLGITRSDLDYKPWVPLLR